MILLEMKMSINEENDGWYLINISGEEGISDVLFSPKLKEIKFTGETPFDLFLESHAYQLSKLLRNKRLDSFYIGFTLTFILWKDKDVAAFNDRGNVIVVDRRNSDYQCYVKKGIIDTEVKIDEIYIDGSFLELRNIGGYVILHKDLQGQYHIYTYPTKEKGSNRIELMAAIEALKGFKDIEKIRIITDSQYVRKGLSEWLICWTRNGFMTANGEKAKNIDLWQAADVLTRDRYIELEWVKGHTDHFENTICDLYAKDAAYSISKMNTPK